jgi:hypothetical protein
MERGQTSTEAGPMLGDDTAGAVSLAMARTDGLTDRHVYWLVKSGRWQHLLPRVFATYSGPVRPVTWQYAALLFAGHGAALSHWSAGAAWRLCSAPREVHVTVPHARKIHHQPGVVIHRSRLVTESEVHPVLNPRRTRIERTVMDLLGQQVTADRALAVVADAVRGGSTTAQRLRETLEAKPRTRWRKIVLDALPDVQAGALSVLELRDASIRRTHNLPTGRRQARRQGDGAEYLDVLIEEFRLHVELDGRLGHDGAMDVWRDMHRDNRSERAGLRHLRYGWADLVGRPCEVAAEQAEILRQQGWTGVFRRCPRCP